MLNPIEEAKFARLKAMCRELKVPAPPEIMIGLKVHDKDGILVFDDVQRGHSWNRNFYNFAYGTLACGVGGNVNAFGTGYMSSKDSSGTIGYSPVYYPRLDAGIIGTLGSVVNGIVLGTGDTAFSPENYTLSALIGSGNGVGQLAYSAMAAPAISYTAGTKTWKTTHLRIFNNNSGGSITIKEVGLRSTIFYFYYAGYSYYLIERSVLSPTVPVANGAQLTVTYEISMAFTAID